MKAPFVLCVIAILGMAFACENPDPLKTAGTSYQTNKDYASLKTVLEGLEAGADKKQLERLLGEPIDMGFDYRYLLDSTGPEGCVVGAVFHLDSEGKVDDKWIGEICE